MNRFSKVGFKALVERLADAIELIKLRFRKKMARRLSGNDPQAGDEIDQL